MFVYPSIRASLLWMLSFLLIHKFIVNDCIKTLLYGPFPLVSNQRSKGIRQWPINLCRSQMMIKNYPFCRLQLKIETLGSVIFVKITFVIKVRLSKILNFAKIKALYWYPKFILVPKVLYWYPKFYTGNQNFILVLKIVFYFTFKHSDGLRLFLCSLFTPFKTRVFVCYGCTR